eukprot:TRINITY_DN2580_c0_g1_i4.p1 TRINITY_DN2580_c0_g1~~TRINITY_DN2580_c0_g1_i4.p1  ORF type:complete len:306 (+),score=34.02 TRINITY_DN2580_c0_g1_i4:221-1138(+)
MLPPATAEERGPMNRPQRSDVRWAAHLDSDDDDDDSTCDVCETSSNDDDGDEFNDTAHHHRRTKHSSGGTRAAVSRGKFSSKHNNTKASRRGGGGRPSSPDGMGGGGRRGHKGGGGVEADVGEDPLAGLPSEERHLFSQLSARILEDLINEYRRPVEMVREGITQIVPLSVLRACHWADIETRICGSPEVSVDGLKHWLETRSFSGPHLQNFWKAISDMSNLQRSQLLQFSVGQRRLPLKQRIRVTLDPTTTVYFPTSSTCFSQLTIPRCSSSEELLGRLIYAITNAVSIDADEQRVTTVLRVGT